MNVLYSAVVAMHSGYSVYATVGAGSGEYAGGVGAGTRYTSSLYLVPPRARWT